MPELILFDVYHTKMYCRHHIKKIHCRPVLNSLAKWTHEFTIELSDHSKGRGISPEGETLSCYEQPTLSFNRVVQVLNNQNFLRQIQNLHSQTEFDRVLRQWHTDLGHNNTYALSLSYFCATCNSLNLKAHELLKHSFREITIPRASPTLLGNILNGGWNAYTNPVLSDFSEYLLIPKFKDLPKQIDYFVEINRYLKDQLNQFPRVRIGKNWVYAQKNKDNRLWIEFILSCLERLGVVRDFDLMIDASAGQFYSQHSYDLAITEKKMDSGQFLDYWSSLLVNYPIHILEDPFSETDEGAWIELNRRFPSKLIAGDNLCASDGAKISKAVQRKVISAVVIKPNQAGTISDILAGIKTAINHHLTFIPSHRSIETASTFLSDLSYSSNASYLKLGLFSDLATILKFNKLIQLYGVELHPLTGFQNQTY